ncbi:MAG TPA: pyridoxamine 5'-phosphate oxidase family protein [Dehalococcoidia bacterium]|nr:pyridoxamine 5'-phosphate oxidase family protein [Dehalococcoidia bacterium]
MTGPEPQRPHMPGYGIAEGMEGALPWSWAQERLRASRNYWVSSVRPDGRPHSMPVWAVWLDGALYFSTARTSVKARNLYANPSCSITTESANEAVILEGQAAVEEDHSVLKPVWHAYKAKYDWGLEGESMFVLRPRVAFGFIETAEQFATAATRWTFE